MKRSRFSTMLLSAAMLGLLPSLPTRRVHADFTFGDPVNLGPIVNSPTRDEYPCLSADGLSLYFDSSPDTNVGLYDRCDLFVAERKTTKDNWGPPTRLGPNVNSPQADWSPHVSADGLELYFASRRPGGYGKDDIWVAKRASLSGEWGTPVNLGPKVNTASYEHTPCLSQDGLTLYFASDWQYLGVSHRKTKDAPWEQSMNMGMVISGASSEYDPAISPDGLVFVFCADFKLWMTTRRTVTSPWAPCVDLGPLIDKWSAWRGPSISRDGQTLFLVGPGGYSYGSMDIWQAPIVPICDFNGDGQVDGKDVIVMAKCWGEKEPLCDIGPFAWGDGVVDVQDLTVLAEYIGKEVVDPTLIAHWALDEAEGATAHDSAGTNNGTLIGNPVWQPAGGRVGGALKFDGGPRFVMTKFVCDPSTGPFSVFAWVKGGAPGQVILSQGSGANWLMASTPKGALAGQGLTSSTVITDGAWHRIGFVWDGSNRILCVDGVEVARDVAANLAGSTSGLYIGGARDLTPGTFWSGLIDDVRIYNRVARQ